MTAANGAVHLLLLGAVAGGSLVVIAIRADQWWRGRKR